MRPIDADALIEDIKSFWDWDSIDEITATTVLKQTMTDISHAPTIDAVPVVRCKDCKYYEPYTEMFTNKPRGDGSCTRARMTQDGLQEINCEDDEFCSYGERKDDEKNH